MHDLNLLPERAEMTTEWKECPHCGGARMNLIEQLRTWDEIPEDDGEAFYWLDLKTGEAADNIESLHQQLADCQAANAKLEAEKEYRYVEQILRPIKILIALAQSAETLADNSEEIDEKVVLGIPSDFETLSENLDLLDELPDDKPGYTLSAAAKAAWALRHVLGENYD